MPPIVVESEKRGAELIECSVEDVALLLRARTFSGPAVDPDDPLKVLGGGEQLGAFDKTTRPTAEQVEGLIAAAAIEVRARIGQDIEDEPLLNFARNVVALRAAMSIEVSYRPEQSNERNSAYDELKGLYEENLAALQQALPDSSAERKGFYSIPTRSDIGGIFPTSGLLP